MQINSNTEFQYGTAAQKRNTSGARREFQKELDVITETGKMPGVTEAGKMPGVTGAGKPTVITGAENSTDAARLEDKSDVAGARNPSKGQDFEVQEAHTEATGERPRVIRKRSDADPDSSVSEESAALSEYYYAHGFACEKIVFCDVSSLPSTGISFYYNHETGELQCVDDKNPAPGRQVVWEKNLTEEEYEKCLQLFDKYKGEHTWIYKYEAYLPHEDFWDAYLKDEIDLEKLDEANETLTDRKLQEKLLYHLPDSVREAWKETLLNVGDVFGALEEGKLVYFSEFYRQVFGNLMQGKPLDDILGTTEDDAARFAKEALERLKNAERTNKNMDRLRMREMEFYEEFISRMEEDAI